MTPSVLVLVPYKPCFLYAIQSSTGQDYSQKKRSFNLPHKVSTSAIIQPTQGTAFSLRASQIQLKESQGCQILIKLYYDSEKDVS